MNDTCATVTVIVRTIGRSSLEAALASIDLQARSDVHVVVVDASGKGQQLPLTTCPVRVVSKGTTLHRTRAANVGLDSVQTRWALFLDDDDVLLAGHLDKLTQALAEVGAVGDAVLAHTGVALLRADGPVDVIDQAFEPWELLLGNCMPIHAALFDAALVQARGLRFDETLDVYEDWDFWLQMQCLGRFVHVPGVSAHYQIGADSSAVHQWPYGAPAYWCIWQKWWSKAPAAWWVQALRAGVDFKPTLAQWQGTQAQLSHVNVQLQEAYEKWHADVQSLRQTQVALTHQVAQTAAVQTALQVTQAERDAYEKVRDEIWQVQAIADARWAEGMAKGEVKGRVEGKAEGETKARRDTLLRLLGRAGIALTDADRARIQACLDDATLDRWTDSVFGAKTAADVLP